jgi:hypothetical protein
VLGSADDVKADDRAMQAISLQALDPVAETTTDPNSTALGCDVIRQDIDLTLSNGLLCGGHGENLRIISATHGRRWLE